jgi:hypothetical protein
MDNYTLAQIISFFGFSLLLYGVASKSRRKLIGFDATGLTLVTLHWYLLGAEVAAAVNGIFIGNDLIALLLPDKIKEALRNAIAGALMLVAGFLLFQQAHDILPLVASALILFAIQQKNLQRLRFLMIFASLIWSIYGITQETWVQVIFGILITVVHVIRLIEASRDPEPDTPAKN